MKKVTSLNKVYTILICIIIGIIILGMSLFYGKGYSITITKGGRDIKRSDPLTEKYETVINYKILKDEFLKVKSLEDFKKFKERFSPGTNFMFALIKNNEYNLAIGYKLFNLKLENLPQAKIDDIKQRAESFLDEYKKSKGTGVSITKGKEIIGGLTDIGIILSDLPKKEVKEYCQKISEPSRNECLDNYELLKATSKDDCKSIIDTNRKTFCELIVH